MFHSQHIDWLSVDENKAYIQGSGSLGREEGFHFLISVVDQGGGNHSRKDQLRIVIRKEEVIVYDNQRGDTRYAAASMPIRSGSIRIHEQNVHAQSFFGKLPVPAKGGVLTQGLRAYPTELNEQGLWLEFPALEKREKLQLSIFDVQGRRMAAKSFSIGEQGEKQLWKLDHQAWNPGIYLLLVEGKQLIHQQKLIK